MDGGKPLLVGNRGWLLIYMVCLAAQLVHDLGLTIASVIIYANPSSAGRDSFIPLWALLVYVVSNLGLIAYGVVLFVLMLRKRRAAIPNNIAWNALSVAFLISWFFLAPNPRSAPSWTPFRGSLASPTSPARGE